MKDYPSENHFLDIGANIGQTFDWYLSKTPKYDGWHVWCFEPSPRHYEKLVGTKDRFKDRYKIKLCTFGLSDKNGISTFYEKADPLADSFLSELRRPNDQIIENKGDTISVKTVTISNFIEYCTEPNDKIVIKLDCEGSEYSILLELLSNEQLLNRIEKIMVEWHRPVPPGVSIEDLKERFKLVKLPLEDWPY
jgi:FkbM family methyltransferase